MKVPEHIKAKMRRVAKLNAKSRDIMHEVDEWFYEHALEVDVRSGNGYSLEELEYGNDVTDEFVKWFEAIAFYDDYHKQ